MSCNTCGVKFNFFHKELGCSNCGLSFCSKCLKQKCKIPNKGNVEQHVCKLCYTKFAAGSSTNNTKQQQQQQPPPPDIYLKRLENLENPSIPPITIYHKNNKLDELRAGLSATDLQILDRLQKLKDGNKTALPLPSDSEIRTRLANLKGENPYVEGPTGARHHLHNIDTRNDQQKVDSLLEQFVNERGIELANNPQDEIEARLASLRERGVRPNEGTYITNLHDVSSSSEEDIDKITRKIMAEVAIDKKCDKYIEPLNNVNDDDDVEMDEDELPWCVLCNKDGYYRCLDCGNDIYCAECSNQVHQEFEQTDHKIIRFKPKLKQ